MLGGGQAGFLLALQKPPETPYCCRSAPTAQTSPAGVRAGRVPLQEQGDLKGFFVSKPSVLA